jgi:hypothetical protein
MNAGAATRGEMMGPRYVMIALAGGLLAGMLATAAPAENPMTPVRPVEPEKTAGPATSAASADPQPAMPAPRSTTTQPAAPIRGSASSAISADAGIAETSETRSMRARRHAGRDRAAGIRPGRWEFTARLRMPASMSSPSSAAAVADTAGSMQTSYTTCIERDNAVPADLGPQCRLERQDRRGPKVSWSISCANTGVRADGRAKYRGDTMQASVVSHIPAAGGRTVDLTQHLTGRYLGACLPPTAALPSGGPALPAAGNSRPPAVMPAAAPDQTGRAPAAGSTAPAASSADTAVEAAPAGVHGRHRHLRHARHAHRAHGRHRGRSVYRVGYGGASFLGPRPSSGAGP